MHRCYRQLRDLSCYRPAAADGEKRKTLLLCSSIWQKCIPSAAWTFLSPEIFVVRTETAGWGRTPADRLTGSHIFAFGIVGESRIEQKSRHSAPQAY